MFDCSVVWLNPASVFNDFYATFDLFNPNWRLIEKTPRFQFCEHLFLNICLSAYHVLYFSGVDIFLKNLCLLIAALTQFGTFLKGKKMVHGDFVKAIFKLHRDI